MYELIVLTCSRGLSTPVPGAAADLVKGMCPTVLVNSSSGSPVSKGTFASSPASSRRPIVWSMNWPQANTHWVTPRSEKRFWCESLKMRLLR